MNCTDKRFVNSIWTQKTCKFLFNWDKAVKMLIFSTKKRKKKKGHHWFFPVDIILWQKCTFFRAFREHYLVSGRYGKGLVLICMYFHTFILIMYEKMVPSWSRSYGSWIYNSLCKQYISPLTLWVRIPLRRGVLDTTLCDNVWQW